MGIDTAEVLEAAGTKWNFLSFKPGLVGGHCIGVDPYYLAQKAQEIGYHSEIILAGRRLNDSMGKHVASETIKLMIKKGISIQHSKILILGFTFKEDCPDFRNTRVIDIIKELLTYDVKIEVVDPWANPEEVLNDYGILINNEIVKNNSFDATILAVGHQKFKKIKFSNFMNDKAVIYDVKGVLDKDIIDGRL